VSWLIGTVVAGPACWAALKYVKELEMAKKMKPKGGKKGC
jgi:hypothetical protein